MKLAVIGTAGRREDGDKLRKEPGYWRTMCAVAQITAVLLKPEWVVSGGAAYADHLAVWLYLEGLVPNLSLHLPAAWMGDGYKEEGSSYSDDGRVTNHYHRLFSSCYVFDSLYQIQQAIAKGALIHVNSAGFKARNTDVANEASTLLAFTFGDGLKVKDGGTADTVRKFLVRREGADGAVRLPAYHFCLNAKALYPL